MKGTEIARSRAVTDDEAAHVCRIVSRRLARHTWLPSREWKSEPGFSTSVLVPALTEVTSDFRKHGFTVAGHGSAPMPIVQHGLLSFSPDAALLHYGRRFLAIEAKFLGAAGRQQSLTQAIGQAIMYRSFGYDFVTVALVDRVAKMRVADAANLSEFLGRVHVGLIALIERNGKLRHLYSKSSA